MVWNFRTRSDPVRRLSVVTPCLLPMLLSTQGPFPPRTLPRFPGTTDPSATLTARPAPRGVPVDLCCISVRASRVAALFLFHACRRQYPDGNGSVPVSLASPSANGLPLLTGGSTSVLPVSRPARRSLAFRPAWSLNRPRRPFFTRVLQSMSLPPWPALAATNRSDSCWAGFAPARRRRLSTAWVSGGMDLAKAAGLAGLMEVEN